MAIIKFCKYQNFCEHQKKFAFPSNDNLKKNWKRDHGVGENKKHCVY